MTNATFTSIEEFRDIESLNHYRHALEAGEPPEVVLRNLQAMSRDNARTPMQWDGSANAGFTTGTPWIGVNPNHERVNAEAELADEGSVLHHYRRLIELRHCDPVVAHGTFRMLLAEHPHVYAFTRRLDDVELLVLGNFSSDPQPVDVPDVETWVTAEVLVGEEEVDLADDAGLTLAPWEGRVYRRRV